MAQRLDLLCLVVRVTRSQRPGAVARSASVVGCSAGGNRRHGHPQRHAELDTELAQEFDNKLVLLGQPSESERPPPEANL